MIILLNLLISTGLADTCSGRFLKVWLVYLLPSYSNLLTLTDLLPDTCLVGKWRFDWWFVAFIFKPVNIECLCIFSNLENNRLPSLPRALYDIKSAFMMWVLISLLSSSCNIIVISIITINIDHHHRHHLHHHHHHAHRCHPCQQQRQQVLCRYHTLTPLLINSIVYHFSPEVLIATSSHWSNNKHNHFLNKWKILVVKCTYKSLYYP